MTAYGPEEAHFLQGCPALDSCRLTEPFGYTPSRTSTQALADRQR